jgi:hypothetical protein
MMLAAITDQHQLSTAESACFVIVFADTNSADVLLVSRQKEVVLGGGY